MEFESLVGMEMLSNARGPLNRKVSFRKRRLVDDLFAKKRRIMIDNENHRNNREKCKTIWPKRFNKNQSKRATEQQQNKMHSILATIKRYEKPTRRAFLWEISWINRLGWMAIELLVECRSLLLELGNKIWISFALIWQTLPYRYHYFRWTSSQLVYLCVCDCVRIEYHSWMQNRLR